MKQNQIDNHKKQQDALQEKYKDDPAGASRHMDRISRQAKSLGQDIWATAKIPALGECTTPLADTVGL